MNVKEILEKGFVDRQIPEGINLKKEIDIMRKNKNAIILAHYYQTNDIQDIADFVGDSLDLSRKAANNDAYIIVFAGVHFMAETAKILSPEKMVLIPDLFAGCSLADSCPPKAFSEFIKKYPDHVVISYINCSAEIKALSDIICTSSNAEYIISQIPPDKGIVFAPDKNLGNYIKSKTGRQDMVIWDGACHVHEEFSVEKIIELKKEHPEAKLLAHPECKNPVLMLADHIGSTSSLLKFSKTDSGEKYIVATESGIIHQMRKNNPGKDFIPAPPIDATCGCNDCEFMKRNTMEKIYNCLRYELPEITMDKDLMKKARKPIQKMLDLSENIK
ncbi:MAG: quinolinate synthase NadA [bacterium]